MNAAFYIFVLSVTAVVAAPEYNHHGHHKHPVSEPPCSGGPLDERVSCASTCVKSCDNPNPKICPQSCLVNGCYCKKGSVRDETTGQCVLLKDCPKKPEEPGCSTKCKGGPNDELVSCGTACPLTCDKPTPGACTKQCLVDVCQCKKGYVRDTKTGKCVLPSECPKPEPKCTAKCKGGPHDKCTLCGSGCAPECNQPKDIGCAAVCLENVCQCEEGWVRDTKSGKCVRPNQCPKPEPKCTAKCTGGPHDKCTLCGSGCAPECNQSKDIVCAAVCLENVCQCEKGWVRDTKSGKCVRPNQCPKPEPKCTAKCTGGPHDKCTMCGSGCELNCDQTKDIVCAAVCLKNVCECEKGYVRDKESGKCVLPSQCPKPESKCTAKCKGGPHDKCTICGTGCPLTCEEPERGICSDVCVENTCECEDGFVRNAHGKCIPLEDCPRRHGW